MHTYFLLGSDSIKRLISLIAGWNPEVSELLDLKKSEGGITTNTIKICGTLIRNYFVLWESFLTWCMLDGVKSSALN